MASRTDDRGDRTAAAAAQALGLGLRGPAALRAPTCGRRRRTSASASASAARPRSRCRWRRSSCPPPRLRPPASLAEIVSDDRRERVTHALGKAYRDVVRGFRGQIDNPPDLVARPRDEAEVEAVLGWCADAGRGGDPVRRRHQRRRRRRAARRRRLRRRGDDRPRRARPGARGRPGLARGADPGRASLGPALNEQLAEHGLTLRHFPQSFEYSTLGGWIATRAGGHFATVWTHIDDLVESVRAITPTGAWESRRLPGSGAGPEPRPDADRLRGHPRRDHRGLGARARAPARTRLSAGVAFESFAAGAEAVRALAQSGLNPSNCRLLDETEAEVTHADDDGPRGAGARLRVRPPAGRRALRPGARARARPRRRGHGRAPDDRRASARADGDAVGAWRHAFLAAPVPARHVRRRRRALRHLRDRDHLGPLRGVPRDRDRGGAAAVAEVGAPAEGEARHG